MEAGALISELKRRRVIRALIGYGIAAFAVLQIIEPVMHGLHWPEEVLSYVVVTLAVGFPIVVSLAWIFDVNAGRMERTAPQRITGTRLAVVLVGIGVIAAAPGVVWYFAVRGVARGSATRPAQEGAGKPSIAVLPFADMSAAKDQEYFSDGIAEQILDNLAQVEGLKVIGRTSSFAFKGKSDDLRVIGERLGVAHVLEGSVRKEGGRIRITAQLLATADGSHVWSKSFDREMTSIFAVQDEIARAVVDGLRVKLLPGTAQPPTRVQTANLQAYDQYLLGTHLVSTYNPDDVKRAMSAFEKAVTLDPGLGAAWARLALVLWWGNDLSSPDARSAQQRAIVAAEKGVSLAPSLADAYAARSRVRDRFQWDFVGADEDDARAVALAPNSSLILNTHCIHRLLRARFAEAVEACQKSIDLDPLVVGSRNILTLTYLASEKIEKARAVNTRVLEISPGSSTALFNRCALDVLEGRRADAREHCGAFSREEDRLLPNAMMLARFGTPEEAAQAEKAFIARFGDEDPYSVAELFAWRGKADSAFEWLDRAYDQHVGLSEIKSDWILKEIRIDPRYTALLKKMNLPLD